MYWMMCDCVMWCGCWNWCCCWVDVMMIGMCDDDVRVMMMMCEMCEV